MLFLNKILSLLSCSPLNQPVSSSTSYSKELVYQPIDSLTTRVPKIGPELRDANLYACAEFHRIVVE